jgi:hypothetical protein
MSHRCSNPNCFAHEGEECALGNMDHTECECWEKGAKPEGSNEVAEPASTTARVNWSGSSLGLTDLANITPRARTILVGVLGAHDAGKTTMLVGNYLQLLQGATLADAQFSGSRSLGAWESLASWVRKDDAAREPTFPPHTSRGVVGVPGLLHLALRNPDDEFRDVLLTDAPGEWFTQWAINEDAGDAEGARWVIEHADAFLVFADSERLCGSDRGQARNILRQLLERLGSHVGERPVQLIWAKDDHEPKEGIQNLIRRTLNERIPHAIEGKISTTRPNSMVRALDSILRSAWTPLPSKPLEEPVLELNSFTAYRG